jgi:predicted GNAT family acetyltransferase
MGGTGGAIPLLPPTFARKLWPREIGMLFSAMSAVTDHPERQRFELIEDGKLAYADYRVEGDVLVIPYVYADPALRGRGTAGRLMTGVLEVARERGLKVEPICGYAAAFIERHAEYRDLRA